MIRKYISFRFKYYLTVIIGGIFLPFIISCSQSPEPAFQLPVVNGQVTVKLPDSSVYSGEVKNGLFNGKGKLVWRNGDEYQGNFVDGLMSGEGHKKLASGEEYTGAFKRGLYDGKGKLLDSTGDRYEGNFENGNFQGKGVFTAKSGMVYQGHFDEGNASGQGTITWPNGNSYKGEINDWRMSGKGEFRSADVSTYSGDFIDGKYDGQGILKYDQGDIYEGQFKRGYIDGKGTYTRKNGEVYKGEFKNGRYDGNGELHDQFGSIYRGEFKQGEFSGSGVIIYTNGSTYTGEVNNWVPNGKGTFRYGNGTVYAGGFKNGEMDGQGVLTILHGQKYKGGFKGNYYDGRGEIEYMNGDRYVGEFKDGEFNGKGTYFYKKPKGKKKQFDGEWRNGELVLKDGEKIDRKRTKRDKLFVEETLYQQNPLINKTLELITTGKPGRPELYFISFGSYASQDVFMKEALFSRNLFDKHYETKGYSVTLINNKATVDLYPVATVGNLRRVLNNLGSKMNKDEDILFLFVSSHGSKNQGISVQLGGLYLEDLSVSNLSNMLKESGIKWKVIVISACYSGAYVDALKDKNTMIMTSSKSDHVSFGCSDDAEFTFFGKALLKDALVQSDSFENAFQKAKQLVSKWEAREGYSHSEPQLYTTTGIERALSRWRKSIHRVSTQNVSLK